MNTSNSLSVSPQSKDCRLSPNIFPAIGSSPEAQRPESTFGKKTPELKEPNSNSELHRSGAIRRRTGVRFSDLPNPESLTISHRTYIFEIIFRLGESLKKMLLHLFLTERSLFIGEELVVEKVTKRGKKRVLVLTLKTLTLNGGMVIEVMRTLSLMNFEEVSRSVTYLDGSINTLYLWKEREELPIFVPQKSGSPQTSTPDSGTQS